MLLDPSSIYTAMSAAGKGSVGAEMSRLDKMTDEEKKEFALRMARSLVKGWESIEEKADTFIRKYGLDEQARVVYVSMLQEMQGGEEVYLAAKKVLDRNEL